jgi:hypothetical protein
MQVPPVQVPPVQGEPSAFLASAGQVRVVPSQVSATSQVLAAPRQIVALATGEQVPALPLTRQL